MLEEKGLSVKFDNRETHKPGWKFAEYELKGVPVRLAIGPKDYDDNTVEIARRDTLEKKTLPQEGIESYIEDLLTEIQQNIFQKALAFRDANTFKADNYDEMKDILSRLPQGESVLWCDELHIGQITETDLQLPPEQIVDAIREYAEQCGLDFTVTVS